MIVLMLYEEQQGKTKEKKVLVSHGVDTITLSNVILPQVPPQEIGYFNYRTGEWLLKE